jgi:hypothetical protein
MSNISQQCQVLHQKKKAGPLDTIHDSISYPNPMIDQDQKEAKCRVLNYGKNPMNSLKAFIFQVKLCNLETKEKGHCTKVHRPFFGKYWPTGDSL